MKPIFIYTDYRKYLADRYKENKLTKRHFSYQSFAQKSGVTSPVFLKLVIEETRNISRTMIPKFSMAAGLNARESMFFEHLVLFNQAKTAVEKQEHYTVIISMIDKVSERQVECDQHTFFTHWYTPVVRELICCNGFTDNWNDLAMRLLPPITTAEARSAVKLLLRLQLVEVLSNSTFKRTNNALRGSGEVGSLNLRAFNKQMVERALDAVETLPVEKRHVSGITGGISATTYKVIETEIEAFKDRIISKVNNDEGNEFVCQLIH